MKLHFHDGRRLIADSSSANLLIDRSRGGGHLAVEPTRERNLFAALKLFSEKGYLSTSVADILREAAAASATVTGGKTQ